MLKKIYAAGLIGTKGVLVRCEADVEQGFPTIVFALRSGIAVSAWNRAVLP